MQLISKTVGRSHSSKNYARMEPQDIRLGPQILSMMLPLCYMGAKLEHMKMNMWFYFFPSRTMFFYAGKNNTIFNLK